MKHINRNLLMNLTFTGLISKTKKYLKVFMGILIGSTEEKIYKNRHIFNFLQKRVSSL